MIVNQESKAAALHPEPLTPRQLKLICILAENPSIKSAAEQAGVGRTTAHRWLKEAAFQEELTRRRHCILKDAMGSVQTHTMRAVQELVKLLDSSNEWLRRQTCKDILNYSLKIREIEGVEKRLRALEEALSPFQHSRN
jgi:transposase